MSIITGLALAALVLALALALAAVLGRLNRLSDADDAAQDEAPGDMVDIRSILNRYES